ncbi:MAG: peptidyl-tRNA hydrolase [Candidatus Saccharibacteria bacterium]|nr:peptidyl-tRNA hydrolase [Candidatus Saccharibacteria bacterium]
MKIVLAQGNPGDKYKNSRHNVGFMILDEISSDWKTHAKFHADISERTIAGEKVLLVKPRTFYNETGQSARAIIDFYKLNPAEDLLVIHDDLALERGIIRVRKQGSDAGNNGIKSITAHVGEHFHRLRIGIGPKPHPDASDVDFVLGSFTKTEKEQLEKLTIPIAETLVRNFAKGTLDLTSHKLFKIE